MRVLPAAVLAAVLAPAVAGCGAPPPPLDQLVQVNDVVTGWFDAGKTDDGKNKIVPSISLKLTNKSAETVGAVQLNCIFRRVGDPEESSNTLVRAIGRDGIEPGVASAPVVVRGSQGYTGLHTTAQLLQHRLFVDFKVDVFGKHGSATWVKLGEFKIDRQLLTR
jgi:hypothetical protein